VPSGRVGHSDHHIMGRVSCSFGQFGTSMGMYLNQTTMLCLSPHIAGNSDDYSRHPVTVAIAFNSQDFLEETSSATVTFVGTGSAPSIIGYIFTTLLIALFLIALMVFISMCLNTRV